LIAERFFEARAETIVRVVVAGGLPNPLDDLRSERANSGRGRREIRILIFKCA
jgi:hypothetical protein